MSGGISNQSTCCCMHCRGLGFLSSLMCMISSSCTDWTVTKGTAIAGFPDLPLEVGDTTVAGSGKLCFLLSPKIVGQVTLWGHWRGLAFLL